MMSHNFMNINPEACKYKHSDAPSRRMWQLIDIILVIYIIYRTNFYTVGKPRISAFKLYAACNDPCDSITFFAKFEPTLCC